MEAYTAVYDEDLREELEEEQREVEELGLQMIENAAYVLFSQGYDVNDVISYFTEATVDTITEDFVNYAEGRVLLESVVVSDAYIEEQFQQLEEGLLNAIRGGIGRVLGAGAGAIKGGGGIRNAVGAMGKSAWRAGKQTLSRAATGAKELVKKIPGAQTAQKFAQSGPGKLIRGVGGKVIPGVGAALYGADAADRLKKGDWGGAALSGLGAATSFGGPIAALAPLGIQMATDAAGLTGDKSKKGSKTPAGPPSLKAKQDYAKSKGKYYSSSDQKTYKNYNDALAAKNSRRGVTTPSAPAASDSSSAPSGTPSGGSGGGGGGGSSSTPSSAKSAPAAKSQEQSQAQNDSEINKKYDELRKTDPEAAVKYGKEQWAKKYGQPTTGPEATEAQKTEAGKDVKSEIERQQEKMKKEQEKNKEKTEAGTTSESYEPYDLVLEYLLSQGHVDTVEEANYVMLEMDAETIQSIVEDYQ